MSWNFVTPTATVPNPTRKVREAPLAPPYIRPDPPTGSPL
jgi:hypothetical protein